MLLRTTHACLQYHDNLDEVSCSKFIHSLLFCWQVLLLSAIINFCVGLEYENHSLNLFR